jgi:protein kinase-like protein
VSVEVAVEERVACPVCRSVFRTPFARCPRDGALLRELATDPLVGTVLADRYLIEALVGEGGMGIVYRARHVRMSRRFAIKVLFGDFALNPKMQARFAREAEAASRLSHPNLISVLDFGDTPDGLLYLAMDFAEGPSLHQLILREAPLDGQRILRIMEQLCQGLAHAHDKGLVHRDFKPENVIVTRDDDGGEVARIVDFGIAMLLDPLEAPSRLTTDGLVLGTPAYMAPEQSTNSEVDHRADLFSLGLILYEMLSGVMPFEGPAIVVARLNLASDPPPIIERVPGLSVDPLLEALAFRLMSKDPEARPQTAREVLRIVELIDRDRDAAAEHLLGGEPGAPLQPLPSPPSGRVGRGASHPGAARTPVPGARTPLPGGAQSRPVPVQGGSPSGRMGAAVAPPVPGARSGRLAAVPAGSPSGRMPAGSPSGRMPATAPPGAQSRPVPALVPSGSRTGEPRDTVAMESGAGLSSVSEELAALPGHRLGSMPGGTAEERQGSLPAMATTFMPSDSELAMAPLSGAMPPLRRKRILVGVLAAAAVAAGVAITLVVGGGRGAAPVEPAGAGPAGAAAGAGGQVATGSGDSASAAPAPTVATIVEPQPAGGGGAAEPSGSADGSGSGGAGNGGKPAGGRDKGATPGRGGATKAGSDSSGEGGRGGQSGRGGGSSGKSGDAASGKSGDAGGGKSGDAAGGGKSGDAAGGGKSGDAAGSTGRSGAGTAASGAEAGGTGKSGAGASGTSGAGTADTGNTPAAPAPPSIDTLTRAYRGLGKALDDLVRDKGEQVAAPLRKRYFSIPYADAVRNPAVRAEVADRLEALRRDVERASK